MPNTDILAFHAAAEPLMCICCPEKTAFGTYGKNNDPLCKECRIEQEYCSCGVKSVDCVDECSKPVDMSLVWRDAFASVGGPIVTDTSREDGIIRLITAFQPEPTAGPLLPIGAGPAVVIHLSKTQTEQMFKGMNKRGFYLDAFHGNAKQLKQHAGGRIGHAYVFDDRRGLQQNTLFVGPPVFGPVFIQYGPKTWDALDDAVKRSSTLYLIEMMERNGAI